MMLAMGACGDGDGSDMNVTWMGQLMTWRGQILIHVVYNADLNATCLNATQPSSLQQPPVTVTTQTLSSAARGQPGAKRVNAGLFVFFVFDTF